MFHLDHAVQHDRDDVDGPDEDGSRRVILLVFIHPTVHEADVVYL